MTSAEAAACLGVKRATLYSYVARGLVRTVDLAGRHKRYVAADVWALKRRAAAAKGHAAAAAVAMDWGAPVLSTAISAIDRDGPIYRGRSAWTLAEQDVAFESVARGLWAGFEDADPTVFDGGTDAATIAALTAAPPADPAAALVRTVALAVPSVATPDAMMDRLVGSLGFVRPLLGGPDRPGRPVAERLVGVFGLDPRDVGLVDRALVLCADHELNASTFAARVAASTGASLPGALLAALGTFFGPRHGEQSLDVAALVDEAKGSEAVLRQLAEGRLRGFGHPLYPDGDPRAVALLGWLEERGTPNTGLRAVLAFADAARRAGAPPPALDVGLLALGRGIGAPDAFAMTVFAVGRAAGWLAHILEQRSLPGILRPRAQYTGP